jgi:rhodanese-related sulfurtransferase
VDEYLHTTTNSVWAVGDAVEILNPILGGGQKWAVPLAGPANRQGRMVADNILGPQKRKYKGTYAVSVVRSFELYAACVGLNEKFLRSQKMDHQVVHIHPNSHAGYYPGAHLIHLKLIFDAVTGKIFGAQAVGQDGIEKRIDVIATAMQGNMTVQDLADLELCYAPPVGSAKDPVNYAGMAAENIMDGLVTQVEWNDLDALIADESAVCVLDVRNPGEIAETRPIADHAINIPLDELRANLDKVPRNKKIVVSCMSGQRAYYACRILVQNGFTDVMNLGGAYKTIQAMQPLPN